MLCRAVPEIRNRSGKFFPGGACSAATPGAEEGAAAPALVQEKIGCARIARGLPTGRGRAAGAARAGALRSGASRHGRLPTRASHGPAPACVSPATGMCRPCTRTRQARALRANRWNARSAWPGARSAACAAGIAAASGDGWRKNLETGGLAGRTFASRRNRRRNGCLLLD